MPVITSTAAAWPRSLQSTLAAGGLSFARKTISAAKNMISEASSFGIMPALGADSVPNGRSPLIAKMRMPKAMNTPPTMWSAFSIAARSALHLADRLHRRLYPLRVDIPEFGEVGLIEVGHFVADVVDRRLELLGGDGFARFGAHAIDDRRRRALGREKANPQGELDVVAKLFQRRHVG